MKTMTSVAAGTWTVDLTHTQASFAARHLFGQTVHGRITITAGTIEVGQDGRPQRLHATLDPASIDTGHTRRDSDLRGKRFLAVDEYPLMEIIAEQKRSISARFSLSVGSIISVPATGNDIVGAWKP